MSHDDPVPVMMKLIKDNQSIPQSLSNWKDCIFVVKLRHVCAANKSTDPLSGVNIKLPPTNQEQPGHAIPTTGAFILTLIGKWDDIYRYNYSALKYTITHLHDHKTNNQATFDALQEMNRHLNACFTHPIAQRVIAQATGQLSAKQCDITFGLVTNVDKTKDNHPTTFINPCDRMQSILSNYNPSYRHAPSVGWLCLFVYWESCSDYYYHLPIVNLSQHTQFMTTYNPQDLPPAEATAYNALINKWQNEKSTKQLSSRIPKPNELNPYTYLEAWNSVIQSIKDAEAKEVLEKQRQQEREQRQLEQYIKSKSIKQFEEYKRLLLLQQQNDMYNNLYDIAIKTHTSNTPHTTTNQTSSFISSLINNNKNNDNCDANGNNTRNNINTNTLSLSSPSLQHILFNEYYYKEYIKSQLDDLTIMNHLQYYQYLSSTLSLSSGTTYRPRPHIALPSLSSSSSSSSSPITTTTNTSASSSCPTATSTSTIDTLIDLATSLPPQSTTATSLATSTHNDATNSATMGDNNNNNNNINNTNQPTIIIPHQQTTINNNNSGRQQLILLQEQYNNILDQKHILTIQYDDLINKYNNTILQTNETYNKRTATLQQQIQTLQTQITTLEDQLQSSNIKIQTLQTQITTLQDEMITLKDEHENEITTLKEQHHRKEIEAKDILIATYTNNNNTTNTTTAEQHHHHLVNQISFLQQQLQSTNATCQQQLQSKDTFYQQQIAELTQSKDKQIAELTQSKDKQLESKDQQIALLMQMLADANRK